MKDRAFGAAEAEVHKSELSLDVPPKVTAASTKQGAEVPRLVNKVIGFARQSIEPYQIQVRTIVGLNIFIIILFVILVAMRMELSDAICTPDNYQAMINGRPLKLQTVCAQPGWSVAFWANIIDNLAAGLIVASITSWIVLLISPKRRVEEDLAVLSPWNIGEALDAPLAETKKYWFRGRSGRFMRSTVMPALYKAGSRDAQVHHLSMLLPNPANRGNLRAYAHYRTSLASEPYPWDADRIQIEIIATILLAAHLANKNMFFEASVFLQSDFALFRMDMSDDRLVMTREDPSWPALLCSSQSKFYASFHEEFRIEAENGIELDLAIASLPDHYDESHINPAIEALQLGVTLRPEQCQSVVAKMRHTPPPYA